MQNGANRYNSNSTYRKILNISKDNIKEKYSRKLSTQNTLSDYIDMKNSVKMDGFEESIDIETEKYDTTQDILMEQINIESNNDKDKALDILEVSSDHTETSNMPQTSEDIDPLVAIEKIYSLYINE